MNSVNIKLKAFSPDSGEDGTFDILKWADPDLDPGDKTIFDDLVMDGDKKDNKGDFADIKTEIKTEADGRSLFHGCSFQTCLMFRFFTS